MLPIKHVIERNAVLGLESLNPEDKSQIWSALTNDLPRNIENLEWIYMPLLNEALKTAGLK